MALREFGEPNGRQWEVWDTVPATPANFEHTATGRLLSNRPDGGPQRVPLPGRFTPGREGGWLTFASGTERRRLSPIPEGWETAGDEEMCGHLRRADPVASAPSRIGRARSES